MKEATNIRDRVSPAEWEMFRRCRFVERTFQPYPCLLRIEALNEDGGHS